MRLQKIVSKLTLTTQLSRATPTASQMIEPQTKNYKDNHIIINGMQLVFKEAPLKFIRDLSLKNPFKNKASCFK